MNIESTPAPVSFAELIATRHSLRAYGDHPVPGEALHACLEAARLAPSACNAQPWHYIVVREPERRRELARLTVPPGGVMNTFVATAPVLVMIVAERPNLTSQVGAFLKNKPFYLIDIGITAEHFCLQAAELGLGTCMIGWFDEQRAQALLEIPRRRRPVLLITLGYPPKNTLATVAPETKRRKPLSTIASAETYSRAWEA